MKRYSIGQFAKEISVTVQTLRNWDQNGKVKPDYVSPTGHRYYSQKQLDLYSGLAPSRKRSKGDRRVLSRVFP